MWYKCPHFSDETNVFLIMRVQNNANEVDI